MMTDGDMTLSLHWSLLQCEVNKQQEVKASVYQYALE